MKFSNGQWMIRDGYTPYYPSEVYTFEKEENKLTLYAPFVHVQHRGNTLDGGMMSVELSTPLEGIIKVKMSHHMGADERGPKHEIHEGLSPLDFEEQDEHLIIKNGALSARILKSGMFQIEFLQDGEVITSTSHRGMAYIESNENKAYMREQLALDVGELIYGLGERFGAYVKNGQSVDIWNEDGGTNSEQAYKNIPFYMSNKGYGVFVNQPEKVSYEIGSEKNTRVQFSIEGESMEYFIIAGPHPRQIFERYTNLTGKPSLPPAWSFGTWLSTSFTTNYDEETVMSFIDGMRERDIPFDVFHFDCFWMKEFEWCNFEWDDRVFPDPVGMLSRIKEKGLKTCVWINPYIGQKSPLFKEGKEKGYLLKRPDGSVWQWDKWQAGLAVVDFTNPEACDWYNGYLERLMDMGIDSFKTDFGERIPTDVVYHDGSCPQKMHNYYAYLYNKVVFGLLEEKRGKNEAVLFARAAAAGAQKFPVHWGGDCWANYPSMAESLRGGLSFALSGFSYWSHDISGFEQGASPDIFKRWTQFGLLSSHSRYHGNSEYKVPWNYGDEAVVVSRKFAKLKNSLMPYLWRNAVESHQTGVPMMRPMVLEFIEDETCHYLDRQYMFGDALLVAPILNDQSKAKYYAPAGIWTNFLTNEKIVGEKWHHEIHSYETLPLLVKENTIIPVSENDSQASYDYTEGLTIHLFEITDAKTVIYNTEGYEVATIHAKKTDGKIDLTTTGINGEYSVLLRNVTQVKSAANAVVEIHEFGTLIKTSSANIIIE